MRLLPLLLSLAFMLPASAQNFPGEGSEQDWLKANGYFDLGTQLYSSKKYKEAALKYEEAVKIYPHDYHYHYSLGLSLKKAGEGAKAVDAFNAALKINDKDWKIWKGLGNSLFQLGKFEDARQAFESTLKCNPPANEAVELRKLIGSLKAMPAKTSTQ